MGSVLSMLTHLRFGTKLVAPKLFGVGDAHAP